MVIVCVPTSPEHGHGWDAARRPGLDSIQERASAGPLAPRRSALRPHRGRSQPEPAIRAPRAALGCSARA